LKLLFGSAVFLASLFLMRQVLVGTGLASSTGAMLFLVSAVGIPLGGLVLVESALEAETRKLRERIDGLERRLRSLEDSSPPS
jgi:hypothetical protein